MQFIKGVGPRLGVVFASRGIKSVKDVLTFFPRAYEETATLRAGDELREDERVSVTGSVLEIEERVTQSGKHMLGALLALDGSPARVRLLWFNQPYRKQDLRHGQRLLATGRLRSTVISWEMVQPQIVKLAAGDMVLYPSSSLHRVTPVTRGVRIASFFWIESVVGDDGERALLYDLDQTIQQLTPRFAADDPGLLRLTGVYHNLLRRWANT